MPKLEVAGPRSLPHLPRLPSYFSQLRLPLGYHGALALQTPPAPGAACRTSTPWRNQETPPGSALAPRASPPPPCICSLARPNPRRPSLCPMHLPGRPHPQTPALTPAWRTASAPSTRPAALQVLLKLLKIPPALLLSSLGSTLLSLLLFKPPRPSSKSTSPSCSDREVPKLRGQPAAPPVLQPQL